MESPQNHFSKILLFSGYNYAQNLGFPKSLIKLYFGFPKLSSIIFEIS